MKKFLVVLLILAVAGGLFAQGLEWSGSLKTGLEVKHGSGEDIDQGTVTTTHSGDANADKGDGNRLDIKAAYTAEDFGVRFGLRSKGYGAFNTPGLQNAYAWVDLFNDMVNVKAGKIDDGVWSTMGDKNWGMATATGVRVEVKPIEGLNVGFLLPTFGGNNAAGKKMAQTFGAMVFGASFDNDAFGIAAAVDIDGRDDQDALGTPNKDSNDTNASWEKSDFTAILGINLKMIENLKANIEAKLYSVDGEKADSKNPINTDDNFDAFAYGYQEGFGVWLTEKASYAITDQITAGVLMHQQFFAAEADDSDPDSKLKFRLFGTFAATEAITAGLDLTLDLVVDGNDTDSEVAESSNKLTIKPKVSFAVGSGATIDIFDEIGIPLESDGDSNTDPDDPTNKFQIDFTYSF